MKKEMWFTLWIVLAVVLLSGESNGEVFKRGWIVNHTEKFYELKLFCVTNDKYMWLGCKKIIAPKWFTDQQGCKTFRCSETDPTQFTDYALNLLIPCGDYRLEVFEEGGPKKKTYTFIIDENTSNKFTVDLEEEL